MKKFETDFFKVTMPETEKEKKDVEKMKPILSLDEENILYKTVVFSLYSALSKADPKGFLGFKILSSRNLKTQKIHSILVLEYRSDDSKLPMKVITEEQVTTIEEFEKKIKTAIVEIGNLESFMKPLISDFSKINSYKEMVERLKED